MLPAREYSFSRWWNTSTNWSSSIIATRVSWRLDEITNSLDIDTSKGAWRDAIEGSPLRGSRFPPNWGGTVMDGLKNSRWPEVEMQRSKHHPTGNQPLFSPGDS